MTEPTLHSLDKSLAEHIVECTASNKHMWSELHSLKRAVHSMIGVTVSTLLLLVAYFGAKALHL